MACKGGALLAVRLYDVCGIVSKYGTSKKAAGYGYIESSRNASSEYHVLYTQVEGKTFAFQRPHRNRRVIGGCHGLVLDHASM